MRYIILLFIPVLLFCAIAGSRIGAGIEYEKRIRANEYAAWQQQHREQQANLNSLRLRQEEATLPYKIEAEQNAIFWLGRVAIVTSFIVIALIGMMIVMTGIGTSRAIVRRANVWASQVTLDSTTRQYPLLTYELAGVVRIANPNTGQVLRLDRESQPVAQLMLNTGTVQLAGVEGESPLVIEAAK